MARAQVLEDLRGCLGVGDQRRLPENAADDFVAGAAAHTQEGGVGFDHAAGGLVQQQQPGPRSFKGSGEDITGRHVFILISSVSQRAAERP